MKVTMNDKVEAAHKAFIGLGEFAVEAQPGLTIMSATGRKDGDVDTVNYVVLLEKGAEVDLPDRLAKRLIANGHANESD